MGNDGENVGLQVRNCDEREGGRHLPRIVNSVESDGDDSICTSTECTAGISEFDENMCDETFAKE